MVGSFGLDRALDDMYQVVMYQGAPRSVEGGVLLYCGTLHSVLCVCAWQGEREHRSRPIDSPVRVGNIEKAPTRSKRVEALGLKTLNGAATKEKKRGLF